MKEKYYLYAWNKDSDDIQRLYTGEEKSLLDAMKASKIIVHNAHNEGIKNVGITVISKGKTLVRM